MGLGPSGVAVGSGVVVSVGDGVGKGGSVSAGGDGVASVWTRSGVVTVAVSVGRSSWAIGVEGAAVRVGIINGCPNG